MDVGTGLTAAGLVVAVVGAVIAWLQLRSAQHTKPALSPGRPSNGPNKGPNNPPAPRARILPPPHGQLPEFLRGRDSLLNELRSLVRRPDGKTHVVSGLGGAGKTTVALQLAAEVQSEGRPTWWVSATDSHTFVLQMLSLCRELGATSGEVEEALEGRRNAADLVWRFLDESEGWLLVMDNADDPRVLDSGNQHVSGGNAWLRPTRAGLLLVTSRVGASAEWGRHAEVHRIGALSPRDGARVLLDMVPSAGSPAEAEELAERLGGLPLALHHAGMHLAATFTVERDFMAYRDALDDDSHGLLHQGADNRSDMATTWEMSLNLLASRSVPQARTLLGVLSCFPAPLPVPEWLIDQRVLADELGLAGSGRVADGLMALHSVGLVESVGPVEHVRPADHDAAGVAVHPLVAETTRRNLSGSELGRQTATAAVALVTGAVSRLSVDRTTDWPRWAALSAQVRGIWMAVVKDLDDAGLAALASSTAMCAMGSTYGGSYRSALELTMVALDRLEDRLPPDNLAVLDLRHRHASAKMFLGFAVEAEEEFRGILADRTRVLGPDHPKTLAIRHNLARVLADQERFDEALTQFEDAREAKARVLGPEDPDTLATRHEAARVLLAQGKGAEAEAELRAIHNIKVRVLGPEHPDTLVTRHEIPRSLLAQDKPQEAETELRDLLRLRRRLLGEDHPHVLTTGNLLAHALEAQGRHPEAIEQFGQILDARRRILGSDNTYTLATQEALSKLQEKTAHTSP
ncbi:tetratricopeptide repeat protein [Nonomuraea antimicrobica]|uniref:Tetratricopeptide repeat protein n=1 Tax=Nonomuraea antimicrobica TaxID=561173 RepID=A0ABP7BVA6_9ACTN